MRFRARIDANHPEIVHALEQAGCSVQSLAALGKGVPDILVGRAGENFLLEIKTKNGKLTCAQLRWSWRGQCAVVRTVEEAFRVVGITR